MSSLVVRLLEGDMVQDSGGCNIDEQERVRRGKDLGMFSKMDGDK